MSLQSVPLTKTPVILFTLFLSAISLSLFRLSHSSIVPFTINSGDNGKLVYSIIGGNENEQFRITQNGTIMTSQSLDRETQSLYNLVVMATDQAKPPEKRLSSTVQV